MEENLSGRSHFKSNETVFNEGDAADFVYEIIVGTVRLCKHWPDGRRQITEFALKRDFVGLAQPSEFTLTAEAVNDTDVVVYPRGRLEYMMGINATLQEQFATILNRRFSTMQSHLSMLRQTGVERVANFIFMLFDRTEAKEGESIDISMTRKDIADYLGLRIESVSRFIGGLVLRRIISMPGPHIIIVNDIKLLQRYAGVDAHSWQA